MDKIDTANWNDYFGEGLPTVVHASERYSEMLFEFRGDGLAAGNVRAVSTPGMRLTEFVLNSDKPFQLRDTEHRESAESVFILEGDVESRFPYHKHPLHFNHSNHNIQYSTSFAGEHIIHTGKFHALTITYDLAYLNSLLQAHENSSLHQLHRSIQQRDHYLATPHGVGWDARMAEVIQSLRHSKFQGATQYIFMESKMMELFVLQMEQLHALQPRTLQEKWQKEDQDKIFAVKQYLEHAYLQPLSLKELTYEFGLNEFKLKKGYKHFFNTTVFGHILHLRMEKAKSLLKDRQMTVWEVAQFVGYNNTGSFSYEFKKRFGYSPSLLATSRGCHD